MLVCFWELCSVLLIHLSIFPPVLHYLDCCCSVAKLYLTLCDPMDGSTPGCPVLITQRLLRLVSIEFLMPSNHLILCIPFSFCPQSFPASGSFPVNQFFTSGSQSNGASASATVLPMNIQGWFPLRFTGLISLLSKALSSLLQHNSKASVLPGLAFFMAVSLDQENAVPISRWRGQGRGWGLCCIASPATLHCNAWKYRA